MVSNKNYCPLIYNQVLVNHNGTLRHCCHYKQSFSSLDKLIADKKLSISKINNNQKVDACAVCYQRESKKQPSLRQVEIAIEKGNIYESINIQKFDVRLHNKCNLACSMCNTNDSSLWAKMLNESQYFNLDDSAIDKIFSKDTDLKKLSFQGGEPFYGKDFISFINKLENKQKIFLEIFTNGLLIKKDDIIKWSKQFGKLQIVISVDGTEETYDYIRWPASWKKFTQKSIELYSHISNQITFAFVLQNINAKNLYDFLIWKNKNCPDARFMLTIIDDPKCFRSEIIHKNRKQETIEALESCIKLITDVSSQLKLINQIDKIKKYVCTEQELQELQKYQQKIQLLRDKQQLTDH